ncbi:hypothetical protein IIO_04875 [Bacillus cereus VD115]|nr:hypothetical protein IIO_04875 [Bacillus cereus VD115]
MVILALLPLTKAMVGAPKLESHADFSPPKQEGHEHFPAPKQEAHGETI